MEEEQKKKKVNWFPGHMKSAMEDIEETKIKLAFLEKKYYLFGMWTANFE